MSNAATFWPLWKLLERGQMLLDQRLHWQNRPELVDGIVRIARCRPIR